MQNETWKQLKLDGYKVSKDECGDWTLPLKKRAGGLTGCVYQYDNKTVGIEMQTARPIHTLKTLKTKWPGLAEHQMCDEFSVLFKPKDYAELKRFLNSIGARKKKQYSVETLEKMRKRMGKVRAGLNNS